MRRVVKTNLAKFVHHFARRRQIGDALREVTVRGAVGKQCADAWHNFAKVDVVPPAHDGVARNADIEKRDTATRADNARDLFEELRQIYKVTKCKSARDTVDRLVWHRKPQDVGLHERFARLVSAQHAKAEIDRNWLDAAASEV